MLAIFFRSGRHSDPCGRMAKPGSRSGELGAPVADTFGADGCAGMDDIRISLFGPVSRGQTAFSYPVDHRPVVFRNLFSLRLLVAGDRFGGIGSVGPLRRRPAFLRDGPHSGHACREASPAAFGFLPAFRPGRPGVEFQRFFPVGVGASRHFSRVLAPVGETNVDPVSGGVELGPGCGASGPSRRTTQRSSGNHAERGDPFFYRRRDSYGGQRLPVRVSGFALEPAGRQLAFSGGGLQVSSAISLYHGEQEVHEDIAERRQGARNCGFVATWSALALCALACAVCLRVLFFRGGGWDIWTVAALAAVALMQSAGLRWFDSVAENWRSAVSSFTRRPVLSAFFLAEFVFLSYFVYSRYLWDSKTFAAAATTWTGLKMVVLATAVLSDGSETRKCRKPVYWFLFALAVSGGIATGAFALIDPGKAWLFATLGATSAVLQLRCADGFQNNAEPLFRSSEAMLFPLLSFGLCSSARSSVPLVPVHPAATALVALSIAFISVGWLESRRVAPVANQVR